MTKKTPPTAPPDAMTGMYKNMLNALQEAFDAVDTSGKARIDDVFIELGKTLVNIKMPEIAILETVAYAIVTTEKISPLALLSKEVTEKYSMSWDLAMLAYFIMSYRYSEFVKEQERKEAEIPDAPAKPQD